MGAKLWPVIHQRIQGGKTSWRVDCRIAGKGERLFFKTKLEAQTCAEQKRIQRRNEGQSSFANDELTAHGKTVQDAINFYLAHLRRQKRAIPLADAVAELLEVKRAGGKSKRYIYDLKLRLGRFLKDHRKATVASFTPKDCDSWLAGLRVAAGTQNTFRRDLRTLFSFAVKRGYLEKNPAAATERVKDVAKPPEIFKPQEVAALLAHCGGDLVPYFAIGAFAGLRAAEIERLTWEEIDFEHGLIEVSAQNSKTSQRRLVKITANLAAWLQPLATRTGKVAPANLRRRVLEARAKAGLTHLATKRFAPQLRLVLAGATPKRGGSRVANGQQPTNNFRALSRISETERSGEVLEHCTRTG